MANKTQKNRSNVWQSRFENRKMKLQRIHDEARKYYDIMYAVQNTTKVTAWKSKVFVPVLASKAWDLIARMSDVVPLFNVSIQNELEINDEGNFELPDAVQERQKRIEAKLHYDYTCSGEEPMKLRVFDPLVDAVVAGTGFAQAPWVFETKKQNARPFDASGNMDNTKTITKKTKTGKNGFSGVNFFNVFPADGDNFYTIPYLIVRGYKPLVDLKKAGVYTNLDLVNTSVNMDIQFEQNNNARNRVVNEESIFSVDDTVDMVTYYECYERTEKGIELTVYAEGRDDSGKDASWVQIREPRYPYWHDMFPIVPFYVRKKSFSVYGESLFENNRTLQSATNDLFNHYLDNWNLSIESMIMYEDGSLTNDFVIEPGGEITYTGEPPKQFKFPEPNPQQLTTVMTVLEKGVENATFSQYASGVPNSSADKTQGTAYGVRTISEAATTKIGFFRDNFKQSMRIVGKIWLSNLQQFADEPAQVSRVVNGKQVPDVVLPSDYQGDLELDIDDDSMTPLSKQDKQASYAQWIQSQLMIQKASYDQAAFFKQTSDVPRLNFHEMSEEGARLFSVKDYSRFVLDSSVEIPQEQPKDDTKELMNMSYKDAPPDIQAQIEEKMGLQPSALHDTALATAAMQHGKMNSELTNPMIGMNDGTGTQQTTSPSPAAA